MSRPDVMARVVIPHQPEPHAEDGWGYHEWITLGERVYVNRLLISNRRMYLPTATKVDLQRAVPGIRLRLRLAHPAHPRRAGGRPAPCLGGRESCSRGGDDRTRGAPPGGATERVNVEIQREANFLEAPHTTLYPAVWSGMTIRPEAKASFISTFLAVVTPVYPNIREQVRFAIIGSGASYNWDETGDIDVQAWVADPGILPGVRKIVSQTLLGKTCADLGLAGTMGVQWYAKPGRGTPEENLASQPYACFDLDTERWLAEPFPLTPEFYGDLFSLVIPRAQEVAAEAGALLAEEERASLDHKYWSDLATYTGDPGRYAERLAVSRTRWRDARIAVRALYAQIVAGRQQAYSEGGRGIRDERDALVKVLEVWGIFDRLKHIAQEHLGVDGR